MGCGGSKDNVVPIQVQRVVEEFETKEKYDALDEAFKVISHIKQSFNDLDLDKNGYLSPEELKKGYSNEEFQIADEGIDYIMKNVDTNEDGQVSTGEYIKMLSKLGEDKNEFKKEFYSYLQPNDDEKAALKVMDEIKQSFDQMDLNKNGLLSKDELKKGFSKGDFELSDEGVDWILMNIDNEAVDHINLGEYIEFLGALAEYGEYGDEFRKEFLTYLTRK